MRKVGFNHTEETKIKIGKAHNLDHNKQNNIPENIIVNKSIAEHKVYHRRKLSKLKMPDEENIIVFCLCGCGQSFLKYDNHGRPRRYALGGHWRRHKRFQNATQ